MIEVQSCAQVLQQEYIEHVSLGRPNLCNGRCSLDTQCVQPISRGTCEPVRAGRTWITESRETEHLHTLPRFPTPRVELQPLLCSGGVESCVVSIRIFACARSVTA